MRCPEQANDGRFRAFVLFSCVHCVQKCLGLLTFLPMDEVRRLGALEGSAINEAKKVLAFEITKMIHGEEEATKAAEAAAALFAGGANGANIPSFELTAADLMEDARVSTMLVKSGLCKSQSEARQQIKANAVSVADVKVTDEKAVITADQFGEDGLMLQKGKKGFRRLILK